MTQIERKPRSSGIELLRILCMFLIVLYHMLIYLDVPILARGEYSALGLVLLFLGAGGKLGVNVFFLITGYFSLSQSLKVKKLARLWVQVVFYSVGTTLAALLFGQSIGLKTLGAAFLPILFNQYWFLTAYFYLMLLSPFLNRLLNGLTQNQYKGFFAVLLIMVSVSPMVSELAFTGGDMAAAILMYVVGGYLKRFPSKLDGRKGANALLSVGLYLAMWGACVVIYRFNLPMKPRTFFVNANSPLTIGCAVCLFRLFKSLKPRCPRAINYVAGSTLGVYLIHDAQRFRRILWLEICQIERFENSPYLWLHMLISSLGVFAVCVLIDILRRLTVEKGIDRALDAAERRWRAKKRAA